MTDFTMLVALLVAAAISFALPLIYLAATMLRSGWRVSLIGLLTLALTYAALRCILLNPMFLGGLVQSEDFGKSVVSVALLAAAAGAVCGAVKLAAVFFSRKKPMPYDDAAAVAKIVSSGLAIAFGGVHILSMFLLRLGSVFSVSGNAQRLEEFPERAKLFCAMTGGDELMALFLGVMLLIPAATLSADVIVSIYGLRAKKYWYPLFSALMYVVCVVPTFALGSFGIAAPALYLLIMMLIALRINIFCRDQYYMYDMIARIDEKKRSGCPTSIY